MGYYFSILFVVMIVNLYSIILSTQIKGKILKSVVLILLSICIFRYFILYLFSVAQSPQYLYMFKNFILMSILSIPIVSYLCLKMQSKGLLNLFDKVFCLIIGVIFAFLIYKAPGGIINSDTGYKVFFNDGWLFIVSLIQCCFSGFMIYLSLNYFIKESSIKNRITYAIYLIGYIAAIIECLLSFYQNNILPENIIAEGIILIAIIASLRIKN